LLDNEVEIDDVLFRHGGEGDICIGQVYSFFRKEDAAVGDGDFYISLWVYADDDYFEFPVVDEYLVAGYDVVVEVGVGDVYLFLRADYFFAGGEGEDITGNDGEGAVLYFADPEFWALEVAESGDVVGFGEVDIPDMFDDPGFIFMGAVGEIEPKDVYSGFYKLEQFVIGVTGRSDSGDNLGLMEGMLQAGLLIHAGVKVFR
jgi:hypothetical protein